MAMLDLVTPTATPHFRLVRSTTEPLTPQLAQKFREMPPSPTERLLNESRVKHLRAKADAGLLIPFQWAFATWNGKTYRMNAQHSSNMLGGLDGKFPKGLFAHVDEYEVDSLEGMALLFRQFDDRKSGRTPIDVSGAYQGLYPELADISRDVAKFGIECVTWFNRHVEGISGVLGGDDQYSRFSDTNLYTFLHWLNEINPKKELKVQAIGAAMFGTFDKLPDQAREFWQNVANGGIEFDDTAPATVLYSWLKEAYEDTLNYRVKAEGYYQGCVYAWNAFRTSKTIPGIKSDMVRGGFYKIAE